MERVSPQKIDELLNILGEKEENRYIISGGTDLLVKMRSKLIKPSKIVDISYVEELKKIRKDEKGIYIGGAALYSDILKIEGLKDKFKALYDAVLEIGSPIIRNRGTIGGNFGNASPAGDSIPPMYVYGGEVMIISKRGERRVPVSEFFKGPGRTVLETEELIYSIFLPYNDYNLHYWKKFGARRALAISKLSLCLAGKYDDSAQKFYDLKISLGSVAPTVVFAPKTSEFLAENVLSVETIEKAEEILLSEFSPIDDIRSTAEYRKKTLGVSLRQFLQDLLNK